MLESERRMEGEEEDGGRKKREEGRGACLREGEGEGGGRVRRSDSQEKDGYAGVIEEIRKVLTLREEESINSIEE